ncbi:MAG: T9SS type A sorting domain-containing protein, partial [Flavobacteriales bacterium]
PQTEVYTNTVNSGDTVSYTFTTEMADLSTEGAHVIDVFTALAGDERLESDSLLGNSVTNHGSDTGLEQTVETELALSSTIVEGTTSELLFCGLPTSLDGCLEIESVTIDSITHTFLADLDIFLISPAGDTVELSTDNGGAGDNLSNLVFTDTATNDITLQTGDILPGIYHTEDVDGFAGLYDGQDPNGGWSLFIQDDAGGDDGVLHGWSMTFVDNSPMPVLAYSDTTICLSHVLDLTVEEYDSYLWSTGHNSQTAEVFGDVLGLGTYEVSVTVDQDGCTGVSNSFSLIVDACLGVEELGDLSIDVYPNPSNGQIVLDITGDSEGLMLEVMDVNGKRVYSESTGAITSGLRKTVDLTNLATGMYFLKLDNGTSSTTKKIIKN